MRLQPKSSILTADETQKAIAAGIPGEQVDGNDVLALDEVIGKALEKAHSGKGPTLIEAISYRLSDHTTADDATRYRPHEEVNDAWAKEPIKRLQNYLVEKGWWDEKQEQRWLAECRKDIQLAVADYINTEAQAPEDQFDYLYDQLPTELIDQRQQFINKHHRAANNH